MKLPISLIFFSILLFKTGSAQTAEEVYNRFYQAVDELTFLSYNINRIDTFSNGKVWNKRGNCTLKRERVEPVFGFLFQAKRDDVDEEDIFYGDALFRVNHVNKTYQIQSDQIHRGLLGSPGSQMVLSELVEKITNHNRLTLTKTDTSFVLRFDYPEADDEFKIKNRHTILYLSRDTYLPFYRYHTLEGILGRQVNVAYLTNISKNSLGMVDVFSSKDFLTGYALIPSKKLDKLHTLVGAIAPDFDLKSLVGGNYSLSGERGRVVLLDFWEVWCGPCIESIPKVNKLAEQYRDRMDVFGIVNDQATFLKVKDIVERKNINFPVLFGNKDIKSLYLADAVPLYVLIDKEGYIRYAAYGYSAQLEIEMVKLLN